MCRPLFFHYENVAAALKENLPTPFGIFLEANAKPARGCWHELLKRGRRRYRYRTTFGCLSKIKSLPLYSFLAETILPSSTDGGRVGYI